MRAGKLPSGLTTAGRRPRAPKLPSGPTTAGRTMVGKDLKPLARRARAASLALENPANLVLESQESPALESQESQDPANPANLGPEAVLATRKDGLTTAGRQPPQKLPSGPTTAGRQPPQKLPSGPTTAGRQPPQKLPSGPTTAGRQPPQKLLSGPMTGQAVRGGVPATQAARVARALSRRREASHRREASPRRGPSRRASRRRGPSRRREASHRASRRRVLVNLPRAHLLKLPTMENWSTSPGQENGTATITSTTQEGDGKLPSGPMTAGPPQQAVLLLPSGPTTGGPTTVGKDLALLVPPAKVASPALERAASPDPVRAASPVLERAASPDPEAARATKENGLMTAGRQPRPLKHPSGPTTAGLTTDGKGLVLLVPLVRVVSPDLERVASPDLEKVASPDLERVVSPGPVAALVTKENGPMTAGRQSRLLLRHPSGPMTVI